MRTELTSYDRERDLDAVVRIWREVGWIESSPEHAAALDVFLEAGDVVVGLMEGDAECSVHRTPGSIRYLDDQLEVCAITAVTTSWVGRLQGFASKLTARALAAGAADGAEVAMLGMFEQGFYDRLGFGSGPYQHLFQFDPASLQVDLPTRPPCRLTADDSVDIHHALEHRHRAHGGLLLNAEGVTRAELVWAENPFGLGYRDDSGELTHFVYGSAKDENGPYRVSAIAYRSTDELFELFGLLKSLGDQVAAVKMIEPPEIQLQDLLRHPIRASYASRGSVYAASHEAIAWWQLRIMDLAACVDRTAPLGPPLRFNLRLTDPAATVSAQEWEGIGGDYIVTLGDGAVVADGHDASLATLDATVNAFSRLLFGVRPASSLALTTDLAGPPALLAELDTLLRLPAPHPGLNI
ncbi:MAG: GNAT family N-acetyltransferase [Actinomycetia bacterium]|nr:GNAT family N-acetyltransferase [Actinomycetes bacterium]MCP3913844.1 GNAT family N-acetyltransferase [Actinomycetes bacterium]